MILVLVRRIQLQGRVKEDNSLFTVVVRRVVEDITAGEKQSGRHSDTFTAVEETKEEKLKYAVY